jgi:hypothetical protein
MASLTGILIFFVGNWSVSDAALIRVIGLFVPKPILN